MSPVLQTHALSPTLRHDVVVIGSGPGGSITACMLAEAGRDVLLVEEGSYLPLESCEPFSLDEMVQKYRRGGLTAALGKPKVQYVEGCCVGGGSEINSALYHRTPVDIMEKWRNEFNVAGYTDADMQPHFEAIERDVNVTILPCPAPSASLKLHNGARRLGWKSLEIPRWFKYDNTIGSNAPRGTRQSMTRTFVPRALAAGATLLPNTRVNRLRRSLGRWVIEAHVTHQRRQRTITIDAKTVFIAAGAIHTPLLLQRSGISSLAGKSLQMHPTIKLTAMFPDIVNAADMGVPVHQVKEFSPALGFGCSISAQPHLALAMLDHPAASHQMTQHWQHAAIYYAMIVGEGRGSVGGVPGFTDPLVKSHLTKSDMKLLREGLTKLADILFESGATALYPSITNGPVLHTKDDLKKLPELLPVDRTNLMTIHLFSSCAMGEKRDRCVADSFGKVFGAEDLHLADASLLCTAPGVNPQGSIMAIVRRNAMKFLGQL